MKYLLAILLIGMPALHGMHVFMIEIGSPLPLGDSEHMGWAGLDRIAASSLWGKVAVLCIDVVMIYFGVDCFIGYDKKKAKDQSNDHSDE